MGCGCSTRPGHGEKDEEPKQDYTQQSSTSPRVTESEVSRDIVYLKLKSCIQYTKATLNFEEKGCSPTHDCWQCPVGTLLFVEGHKFYANVTWSIVILCMCEAFFIVTSSLDSGVTAVKMASQLVKNVVGISVL